MTTNIFNEGTPADNAPASYREQLVGEGKKFKDDEALARGKYEADKHAANLEKELSGLREELNKRITYEEVLEQIKAARAVPAGDNQGQVQNPAPSPTIDKEEIFNLVKQTINTERVQSQVRQNVEYARSELIQAFGEDYQTKLNQRATELEISKDFLASMAETSPKAFLKVVLGTPEAPRVPSPNIAPPRSSATVNPTVVQNTYSSYEEMRKKNPRQYWSREVQAQIHKKALENPDSFLK